MKNLVWLLFSFLFPYLVYAADTTKTYTFTRTSTAPQIDGELIDEPWKNALIITDFVQNLPIEGAAPSQHTEVRILYDDAFIYVGAFMFDNHPDSILHELGFRDDQSLNADKFRFIIDPYNKRQDYYDFGVYASGVQLDSRYSDITYDAVWESSVKITDKGWCAEFRIPYAAFRFPKAEQQQWCFQLTRDVRRNREFDQWSLTPSGKSNPMNYWGIAKNVNGIKPPLRLSLTPYLSSYNARVPYTEDGVNKYNAVSSYSFGADVKYGIDERFTVDMTLLPDFSQVQSDNKIKNLSFREVNYEENRPFFKEGTELFNKQGLFYSRRIGKAPEKYEDVPDNIDTLKEKVVRNPAQVKLLNAVKLTGRTGAGLGVGVFNAITDNMYADIQSDSTGEKRGMITEPFTNYNAIVFDQQLVNGSNVYIINTNVTHRKGFGASNVTGAGATLNNKKNSYALDVSAALSNKSEPADEAPEVIENKRGYTYYTALRKTSGNFLYKLSQEIVSPHYNRRDMGFYNTNNYLGSNAVVEYNIYKPNRYFRNTYNSFNIYYLENFGSRKRMELTYRYSSNSMLLSYNNIWWGAGLSPLSNLDYYEPRVDGYYNRTAEFFFFYAGLSSDYRKKLAVDFEIVPSNFFKHNTMHFLPKYGYNYLLGIRYRFNDKLTVSYKLNYNYDPFNVGFVTKKDTMYKVVFGARKIHMYENTLNVKYVVKNNMTLSLNVRHYWNTGNYIKYYSLQTDGDLLYLPSYSTSHNFSYNVFNVDLIYSWQFAPGSLLSIVYKNALEDESKIIHTFNKNLQHTFNLPQKNSFSIKIVYYLDYQRIKSLRK